MPCSIVLKKDEMAISILESWAADDQDRRVICRREKETIESNAMRKAVHFKTFTERKDDSTLMTPKDLHDCGLHDRDLYYSCAHELSGHLWRSTGRIQLLQAIAKSPWSGDHFLDQLHLGDQRDLRDFTDDGD